MQDTNFAGQLAEFAGQQEHLATIDTCVGRWLGLYRGATIITHAKNYFSLYFTLDLLSKLSVKPTNLGAPRPPASYAYDRIKGGGTYQDANMYAVCTVYSS